MPRYVAFLRGVSPLNAHMAELKRIFEKSGFMDVKTVLSSGNVAFSTPDKSVTMLARKIEASLAGWLDHAFYTIVRPSTALHTLVEIDL